MWQLRNQPIFNFGSLNFFLRRGDIHGGWWGGGVGNEYYLQISSFYILDQIQKKLRISYFLHTSISLIVISYHKVVLIIKLLRSMLRTFQSIL